MKNFINRYQEPSTFTTDPREMEGMYTAEKVYRHYTEDVVDEQTGEIISIERREVILQSGVLIDSDKVSQILFYKQAGELDGVRVSHAQRGGTETLNNFGFYEVTVTYISKYKALLYTANLQTAYSIAVDYFEQAHKGTFSVDNIKKAGRLSVLPQKENLPDDLKFAYKYFIVTIQYFSDFKLTTDDFLVFATSADNAIDQWNEYNQKLIADGCVLYKDSQILKATPSTYTDIIPADFCKDYNEEHKI